LAGRSEGNPAFQIRLNTAKKGYVSISGASHEVTIFTDNMTRLNPKADADVSRNFAIENGQSPSVTQGVGIGL
jgi:hypothetical protein